jgi:hypothetical protein
VDVLTAGRTRQTPEEFLAQHAEVFAVFDRATQDSGNISFGVRAGSHRFFVKTAGVQDDATPILSHAERIDLLRNAVRLNRAVSHPALPSLRHVIESPTGPMLVYDWIDGELIGAAPERRLDATSAFVRFRRLPVGHILAALDSIFDQRTTVFTLGRTIVQLLSDGSDVPEAFRGSRALADVAMRACQPEPQHRFVTVRDFHRAWAAITVEPRDWPRAD